MPYVRKLPSGRWQATVYLPDKKRRTRAFPLKGEARAWGLAQESRIQRGDLADPRATRQTFGAWRALWLENRVVEDSTRRGDLSIMAHHINEHFDHLLLASISRMDVQSWVRQLEKKGVGAPTIRRAYNLVSLMLDDAVADKLIPASPCHKIKMPALRKKAPAWFTPDEAWAIIEQLPRRHGIAVALMCWTGLRWGEMAGLRVGDVHFDRGQVEVVGSRTQAGAWKEYPKTQKSRRHVPVPPEVLAMLAQVAGERSADQPLFTTERGGHPWSASNWRKVWDVAVEAAGAPKYSPHTLRHTAASWLVQAGVDLYRVQDLLGHESFATTQGYAHLAPNAHQAIEAAWRGIPMKALSA